MIRKTHLCGPSSIQFEEKLKAERSRFAIALKTKTGNPPFLSIGSLPMANCTRQIWRLCGPSNSKFLIKIMMCLRSLVG